MKEYSLNIHNYNDAGINTNIREMGFQKYLFYLLQIYYKFPTKIGCFLEINQ